MDNDEIIKKHGAYGKGIPECKEMLNEARADERAKQKEVFEAMVNDSADHIDEIILARSNKCEHKEGQHVHILVKNFIDNLHIVRWQATKSERERIIKLIEKGSPKYPQGMTIEEIDAYFKGSASFTNELIVKIREME